MVFVAVVSEYAFNIGTCAHHRRRSHSVCPIRSVPASNTKKKNVNLNRHCLLYLTLYFEFTASTHHYRIAMFDEDCLYSIFWIKYFYWNRTHKIECLKTKINIWKFEQSTESHAQSVTQSSVCELMIIQSAPSWGATSKSYALYDHQAPVTHKRKYSAHHTRRRKLFAK